MGICGGKKKDKKKEGGDADGDGKCVLDDRTMKLVILFTLLVSDFDVIFTILSLISYAQARGIFIMFIIVIIFFAFVYLGGAYISAKEADKFLERFKDKVRLAEIQGISMEDLDDALNNRRIFWAGDGFEATKKRKQSVDTLKQLTPAASGPDEIEIDQLIIALREAEMVGTALLRAPGNPKYGDRIVKQANEKLVQAKKVRDAMEGKGGASQMMRRGSSRLAADLDGPDPHYKPNKQRSHQQMEGRGGDAAKVNIEEVDDNPEDDFTARMFAEEIAKAEAANDANLVKMLGLASIGHIDSYKVDKKLVDENDKIKDPIRALYMICEAKGILHSYNGVWRAFSRRIVQWVHSTPWLRLMVFGWQPAISHTDFSGILNANGLYSFTVGFPQLFFSIAFVMTPLPQKDPAPCQLLRALQCDMLEDFSKPNVQTVIIGCSLSVGIFSLVITVANIILDFPAQLFDNAEKEEEALHFTLQAEYATKTWEDKLDVEVSENIKKMLKLSTQFENNSIPGMEAPGLVIEDVMKLERRAMEKRVAYITHYLTMCEDEKKVRSDLKAGKRKKKSDDDEEEDLDEEPEPVKEPAPLPPPPRQPTAPALPPPRLPSAQLPPIAEPTPAANRVPSRTPSQLATVREPSAPVLTTGGSASAVVPKPEAASEPETTAAAGDDGN